MQICTILHTHLSLCHLPPPSIYLSINRTTSPSIYLPTHLLSVCLLTSYISTYRYIHRRTYSYRHLPNHVPPTYNQSPTYPSTKSPRGPPIYISTGLTSYIPTYLAVRNLSIYLPIYPYRTTYLYTCIAIIGPPISVST